MKFAKRGAGRMMPGMACCSMFSGAQILYAGGMRTAKIKQI